MRIHSRQKDVLDHFDAEYGSVAGEEACNSDIEVYAGAAAISSSPARNAVGQGYRGRHKTVWWRIGVADLESGGTHVHFEGRGQLVVSFLQTFYVEPLLRLKFAARDHALVHAASLIKEDRAVLFVGGSGTGKSSLALQHAAAGNPIQGDNYVIVTPKGQTLAFPRRLRLYSDLMTTNPEVYALLPGRERRRLRIAGLIRRFSLGYANLPRRLAVHQITGAHRIRPGATLDSVYFLTPYAGAALAAPSPLAAEDAIGRIQAVSRDEGSRLLEALGDRGEEAGAVFERAARQEADILERALSGVPVLEILVPRVRNPSTIISEIGRVCGLGDAS